MDMETRTIPLSVLRRTHPTIIGQSIPLERVVGTPQEEARIEQIGQRSEESAQRLKNALLETLESNETRT